MLSILVLISGGGSNLQALCQACDDDTFPARIVAVGADVLAPGLQYAEERNIPTFVVSPGEFTNRAAWGEALADQIASFEPDLIVSAGFMRILPPGVVAQFTPRIINTHPSLLPAFPGAHAVNDALEAGATETGVTVHVIDAGVDTGPILRQRAVRIRPGESAAELHERIKEIERPLLTHVVNDVALGTLQLPTQSA